MKHSKLICPICAREIRLSEDIFDDATELNSQHFANISMCKKCHKDQENELRLLGEAPEVKYHNIELAMSIEDIYILSDNDLRLASGRFGEGSLLCLLRGPISDRLRRRLENCWGLKVEFESGHFLPKPRARMIEWTRIVNEICLFYRDYLQKMDPSGVPAQRDVKVQNDPPGGQDGTKKEDGGPEGR
jgi:hypothetical protein